MAEQDNNQQQEDQFRHWIRSSHFGRKGVIISFLIILVTGLALAFFGQKGKMNLHLPHQGSPLEPNNKAPSQQEDTTQQSSNNR